MSTLTVAHYPHVAAPMTTGDDGWHPHHHHYGPDFSPSPYYAYISYPPRPTTTATAVPTRYPAPTSYPESTAYGGLVVQHDERLVPIRIPDAMDPSSMPLSSHSQHMHASSAPHAYVPAATALPLPSPTPHSTSARHDHALLPFDDDFRILQAMLLTPQVSDHLIMDSFQTCGTRSNPVMDGPRPMTTTPAMAKRASPRHQSPPSHKVGSPTRNGPKIASTRICRIPGCTKGIRSRGLCKAHGGGRRCTTPGCTISDQGGGHCIAHGGGKRCIIPNCVKSAQYKGLCKVHGGSRRCRYPDCSKNGQVKGLCRLHYTMSLQEQEEARSDEGKTRQV